MNPRLSIFAIGFLMLLIASVFALCSCQHDPHAGMVAARMTGQKEYISFTNEGRLDSAAVFRFNGINWLYHPEFGSKPLGNTDPLVLLSGMRAPVLCVPERADLGLHGCLPRAIAEARAKGGHVVIAGNQAYWKP